MNIDESAILCAGAFAGDLLYCIRQSHFAARNFRAQLAVSFHNFVGADLGGAMDASR